MSTLPPHPPWPSLPPPGAEPDFFSAHSCSVASGRLPGLQNKKVWALTWWSVAPPPLGGPGGGFDGFVDVFARADGIDFAGGLLGGGVFGFERALSIGGAPGAGDEDGLGIGHAGSSSGNRWVRSVLQQQISIRNDPDDRYAGQASKTRPRMRGRRLALFFRVGFGSVIVWDIWHFFDGIAKLNFDWLQGSPSRVAARL